jgi:hypothetical protein
MGQVECLSVFNSVIFPWCDDNHNILLFTLYHIDDFEGYAVICRWLYLAPWFILAYLSPPCHPASSAAYLAGLYPTTPQGFNFYFFSISTQAHPRLIYVLSLSFIPPTLGRENGGECSRARPLITRGRRVGKDNKRRGDKGGQAVRQSGR